MNLGQALGELQLEISMLNERRKIAQMPESDAIAELRARLDQAEADAIKFGVQLSDAKRRAHLAEQKLAGTYERLAKYERRDAKTEAEQGDIVATVKAECEAKLRGKDMRIADLERQVHELKTRSPEVVQQRVEVPVQSECQVCRSIKLMVLGVEPVRPLMPSMSVPSMIHRLSDSRPVAPDTEPEHHPNHMSPQAARGIANSIRAALAAAKAPMPVREIAQVIGIDSKRVATNIPHLVRKGDLTRMVVPSQGAGWCYWLKSRPIPAEAKA